MAPPGPMTPAQFLAAMPRISAHCGRPVGILATPNERHKANRDHQLAQLHDTLTRERFLLRATVVGIGAAAVGVIGLGGAWIVRRGLAPLDQLSVAVSQVSERDFRLSLAADGLPTELSPIHARLTTTLDQLRRAFAREKEAVADISHELRTPVAALLTTLDVSLRKPRSAEQYRETMEECRVIVKQLGQLVERVMTLAYLDAGQTKLARGPVELAELAGGAVAMIRPLAEARAIHVSLDAQPITIETDRDKLREVLMNLLHNAVEYNTAAGRIDVTVRSDGRLAMIAVADTGIGMTDDVRSKIFERFYRADPSRTETGVHAGLGLAIVQEYITRLGGDIRVTSEPGRGSTFVVELPAS
jgi:two-component system, OmpR family, heavy metal sensor histidine kinase CusS